MKMNWSNPFSSFWTSGTLPKSSCQQPFMPMSWAKLMYLFTVKAMPAVQATSQLVCFKVGNLPCHSWLSLVCTFWLVCWYLVMYLKDANVQWRRPSCPIRRRLSITSKLLSYQRIKMTRVSCSWRSEDSLKPRRTSATRFWSPMTFMKTENTKEF